MKNSKPFKLAYFSTHPIQYQAPLLRLLARHPDVDLKVFFISDLSVKSFHDKGFGVSVQWDVPLLDGYEYEFLPRLMDRGKVRLLEPVVYGIKKALKNTRWDAVYLTGYAHYALLWILFSAYLLRIPYFFRADSNLVCNKQGLIKDRFITWLVKHASALLWIGSDNRDYYKYYGARDEHLFFTPIAVDNHFFQTKSQESIKKIPEIRKQLNLTEDIPVILFAGKFIKRKNPLLLLEAYARLSSDRVAPPPAYLLYVGDGEERPQLEERIDELGWQSHVKILGFKNQTELPDYFALCDLFVMPSQKEPFGLVINEVMNAGKAIISTNEVGASRDLIDDGRNGFIVPAGDVEALSKSLKRVISDKNKMRLMGLESRKIIEDWNFEQDVKGIVQALRAISEETNQK